MPFERFAGFQAAHDFEQRFLALAHHHGVDVLGRQGLIREQRGMPAAEDDRHLRIEALHLAGDLHGLADHGSGDQGDRQADGVFEFFDHPPLEMRRDGGIDDLYLIPGAQQGSGYGQNTQGSSRFLAGKRRKEENHLFALHGSAHATRMIQPRGSVGRENVKTTSRVFPIHPCKITYTDAGKQKPDPSRHSPTLLNCTPANVVVRAPVATEAAMRMSMAPTQEFRPVPRAT